LTDATTTCLCADRQDRWIVNSTLYPDNVVKRLPVACARSCQSCWPNWTARVANVSQFI